MINTVYLRRKNKVILSEGENELADVYLATFLPMLDHLGYCLSDTLAERMQTLSLSQFIKLTGVLLAEKQKEVGSHVSYQPMYPNFPEQVKNTPESMLYWNALVHYVTLSLPKFEIKKRAPKEENLEKKVIDLGTETEFEEMVRNLIISKTSLSQTDLADIEWTISQYDDVTPFLPLSIPLKENVGFVVGALLKHGKATEVQIAPYFHTATDVLRLAVALSDGDISLAQNTKFRKFKRAERRLILGLLEKCSYLIEEMSRYAKRWIRLGEILHPGEFSKKFPKSYEAFRILRSGEKQITFGSKLESALENQKIDQAIQLLRTKPGEMARRLDHLLRLTSDPTMVLTAFSEVADQVATPVLLQVASHFQYRDRPSDIRTFFPKGVVAKAFATSTNLPEIPSDVCLSVKEICHRTLRERFATLEPMGNVYVDERLRDYMVPFSQRSASKALRTITRGSKITIPDGDTIRFFSWWREGKITGTDMDTGRVDIDLSAVLYDEHWNYLEHISFTNLKSTKYQAYHSGDITSAPNGACEFLDLDIPSILQYGGRYVVASLLSFEDHPFHTLPECFVGWMIRKSPNSGEIFEPSTVGNRIDIASDTQICIPVILDLVERKIIWTDLALKQHPYYKNTVEGNQKGMVLMGQAMTSLHKPNLFELFSLHAKSRGVIVDDPKEADILFSLEEGVTPFELEMILAEFL